MAIDSRAKRQCIAGIPAPPATTVAITPDATPGVEWRQEVGRGYEGIAPGSGAVGNPVRTVHLLKLIWGH